MPGINPSSLYDPVNANVSKSELLINPYEYNLTTTSVSPVNPSGYKLNVNSSWKKSPSDDCISIICVVSSHLSSPDGNVPPVDVSPYWGPNGEQHVRLSAKQSALGFAVSK